MSVPRVTYFHMAPSYISTIQSKLPNRTGWFLGNRPGPHSALVFDVSTFCLGWCSFGLYLRHLRSPSLREPLLPQRWVYKALLRAPTASWAHFYCCLHSLHTKYLVTCLPPHQALSSSGARAMVLFSHISGTQ